MTVVRCLSSAGEQSPVDGCLQLVLRLTERCCLSECQQSGRMMACDPRFHRSNHSPTTSRCRSCPHAPDPPLWSSRAAGGKIPDRRTPVHTCATSFLLRCLSMLIDRVISRRQQLNGANISETSSKEIFCQTNVLFTVA